jgi:threonine/homoserine/homoserine lactone efflux protein
MDSLYIYLLASLALVLTPGPDFIYVLTRGMADGKRSGVVSAIGITTGLLCHTMAAALGLAVLLNTSVYAFWIIKIGGGLYLIYMGFQMIKNRQAFDLNSPEIRTNCMKCFLQGMVSNVVNPKIALFFVAFLPQFVDASSSNVSLQMMGLGLIFSFITVVLYMLLGLFAGSVGAWLRKRSGLASKIRIGSGSVLMLLGLRLVVPQR